MMPMLEPTRLLAIVAIERLPPTAPQCTSLGPFGDRGNATIPKTFQSLAIAYREHQKLSSEIYECSKVSFQSLQTENVRS
jgi:hypothetical protein